MTRTKRLLAMLLSMAMLLTMLPAALAEDAPTGDEGIVVSGVSEAAQTVINLIDALPEAGTVTLDNEEAIAAARAAYNALTDEQKIEVTNLDVLEAAEAALTALKESEPIVPVLPEVPDETCTVEYKEQSKYVTHTVSKDSNDDIQIL